MREQCGDVGSLPQPVEIELDPEDDEDVLDPVDEPDLFDDESAENLRKAFVENDIPWPFKRVWEWNEIARCWQWHYEQK